MVAEAANMPPQRAAYTFFPRTRINRLAVPDPARGQRITAELVAPRGATGVLVAVGGWMRGYELFVADGAALFVWRDRLTTPALAARLPEGRATLPGASISGAYPGSNPFTGTLARVRYAMDGA